VAAYPEMHPQATNIEDDLKNFERKVKAGADRIKALGIVVRAF
jgi:methylenetetrahydrofolate reductase (NADPH)